MFNYVWPIALVIISNTVYQICSKETPSNMSPFAALTITYLVGAVFSVIMFFITNRGENLLKEYSKTNWATVVLGIVIVGLEVGFMYAYRAGWEVGTASIVQSSILAVLLIVVGCLLYKESLTWNKIVGILICLVGLFFVNYKFK